MAVVLRRPVVVDARQPRALKEMVARETGFEPVTCRLEGGYSIQLSYPRSNGLSCGLGRQRKVLEGLHRSR